MGKNTSISCDKYQDMMYDYFSDNLNEERIEKLENHISSCQVCKKEFEQIDSLISAAEQVEDQPLPVGFQTSLHSKLMVAAEELQERKAHRFQYFCKDFITDGKWKVAAPAVLAVALLVGVFGSGLFQDFIHTNDDIITDDIGTSSNDDAWNDDFGFRPGENNQEDTSKNPRTTLRPRATARPTAQVSGSPRSTARPTSTAKSSSRSGSTNSSATRQPTARPSSKTSSGTTARSSATATKKTTAEPTAEKVVPEIEFNDAASPAAADNNTSQKAEVNESYQENQSSARAANVAAENNVEEETAPFMLDDTDANSLKSPPAGGSSANNKVDAGSGENTVYYIHHDHPETLVKEYGFLTYTVDQDEDYHVIMTLDEFNEFLRYLEEHKLEAPRWSHDGNNQMTEVVITKAEIKNEETIAN